jgi:small subunit ribosomal protein S6e
MPFKINISEKSGKTYKLELDSEALIGKNIRDKIPGEELSQDLAGYELEITGASDNAGFASMEDIEGIGLKKVLLTYGKCMKKRPKKEGKRKRSDVTPKGLRLRKTVRGKIISSAMAQINVKVLKEGKKKLSEIFTTEAKAPKANRKEKRKQKSSEPKSE